jgi:hypothetical protein
MARRWEDREQLKSGMGANGLAGHVTFFLGFLFAVLGIIADAAGMKLGLSATSWLLLSIATFAAAVPPFIGWAIAWYLSTQEKAK